MQLPFLKKKEQPSKGPVAPERINELSSRGFSEPEMIDVLRKEGHSPEAIDTALTQSLRMGITEPPSREPAPMMQLPTLEDMTPKTEMPEMPETSLPQGYQQQYPTEDYIDYIVQARMAEVGDRVNEFTIRYQEMEKRIGTISEQLSQLMQTRSSEQQQVLERMDSFGDAVNELNTRIGSLEKVFKETLPALIEGVRALSDLVQRLKREA